LIKFESQFLKADQSIQNTLLIEPLLEILYDVLKKGQTDGSIRQDIGSRELVAIIWSQMLGLLQTLATKKEILHLYKTNSEELIKGHYRIIMQGVSP
jgi:hypothetical protein